MAEMSRQWQKLTEEEFLRVDDEFLGTFRAPGSKNRFVAWDPFERSSRYFKFLLFTTAQQQSPRFFEAYRKLQHRELGRPLTVRCGGCDIDADYLAAVEEWEFLLDARALDGTRTIVEIGAGFGRTCHTLVTLCPEIEEYIIVDLEPMLRLSRAYLQRVVPGANIRFISNDDVKALETLSPDLAINIDSFQEMPPAIITFYMTQVVQRAARFYCKNPVGKYSPGAVGRPDLSAAQLMDVFHLGYRQDVVDIFNDEELSAARAAFLTAYCPPPARCGSTEEPYSVARSKIMDLFPYFLHVLYTR